MNAENYVTNSPVPQSSERDSKRVPLGKRESMLLHVECARLAAAIDRRLRFQ